MIHLEDIWQDYGLYELEEGIRTLFPGWGISLPDLMAEVLQGDVLGALAHLLTGSISGILAQLSGMKNIFIWLLVLGLVSTLMTHFVEIFDRHQIADVSFYFIYLLFSVILLKCFGEAAGTAAETIESIVLFMKLLVPTYLFAVGMATGAVTVGAYYQLLLLLIIGVEKILIGVVLPAVYSFAMLSVLNGIWTEEKLSLLTELWEKGIGWVLKASLGVVTGISIFQSVLTPAIDSLKASGLQKLVSAIPGVGNAADGVVELVLGSASVIKNAVGIVLLILLLVLCAAPLLKIFLIACLIKLAAAFMGIVSSKRITSLADKLGDAGLLLFRTAGTALLLFLIVISVVAATTNRRI